MIKGKEEPISFTIDFNLESDYKISGCAHFEDIDRENEVIAINAIKKALPDFMQHPHLHYQHSERPIGTITEATIDGKGLYIKATIYDTKDTADAWEEIKTGKLNAYSIYGKRTISSPECKLAPEMRISPCRTDGLHLWSISAVGKQAGTHEVNTHTFLDVVKGICTTYYKNEDILIKADTTDSTLIHTATDGTKGGRGENKMPIGKYKDFAACERANSDKDSPGGYCATIEHNISGEWPSAEGEAKKGDTMDMEKGDAIEHYTDNQEGLHGNTLENEGRGESILKSDERNPSEIEKRLKGVEETLAKLVDSDKKVHETIKGDKFEGETPETSKATEEDEDGKREPEPVKKCSGMEAKKGEEEKEKKMEHKEEKEEEVKKATPEPVVEETIVKSELVNPDVITKAQMDTFTKAFTDELTILKARIEKMETETIQKGGTVVIIPEQAGMLSSSERNAQVFGV